MTDDQDSITLPDGKVFAVNERVMVTLNTGGTQYAWIRKINQHSAIVELQSGGSIRRRWRELR